MTTGRATRAITHSAGVHDVLKKIRCMRYLNDVLEGVPVMTTLRLRRIFQAGALLLIANVCAADRPPLHEAARNGDRAKLEALLARGEDANRKDDNGETALNWAIANADNTDIVELLLARGADPRGRDGNGDTPLHGAVHLGRSAIAALLVARGADVNAMSKYGTPLHYAINARRKDMVEFLLAANADTSLKGIDVRARDASGWTPREEAVTLGLNDLVEVLDRQVFLLEERALQQALLDEGRNPGAAFRQLTDKLGRNPGDLNTHRLIVRLAGRMKPAPAIPEEARRHFIEGATIVKIGRNPAEQALAVQSFSAALKLAPWWADAWYDLAVAQELAGQFEAAERSLTLYLLSGPAERELRDAQDRFYALAAKRRLSGGQ